MSTSLTFDIIAKDRASDKFDKLGNSAERSTGKLKKFAAAGAVAVAAGAVLAGKALIGMAQSAVEDEKAQGVLAASMRNAADANKKQVAQVEAWITAQGKAKGVADDDLRPAMSRLVQATGDVDKSQRLAALAMDVSAGTGKSLKSVTDALAKAQTGSLGGLSKMGVATKNADGSTRSLAEVTKDLAKIHEGQSARAADTAAGKMDRLRVMWDEAKESLGARLIPMIESGADKLMVFVTQMEKGEGAGGKVVEVAGQIADGFKAIGRNLDTIGPALGVVTAGMIAYSTATKIAAIATAVQTAGTVGATGATWSLNAALRANPIGIVITALTLLGVGLVVAYKKSETFRDVVSGALNGVKKGFDALGKAGTWLWNNALQPAFKFIVNGVGSILDLWSSMLRVLGKVPGFGWAKDAAEAMANAADKAHALADGIVKIPPKKTVSVTVAYRYTGLRGPGGSGPTRGGPADLGILPRAAKANAESLGADLMAALATGIKNGGKKLDKVLETSRDRLKASLSQIRDDMKSMSESIASALNPTDFGSGLTELMASLTGNGATLSGLTAVFAQLKGSVSKGFLSALMQSGNGTLATQLANDPAAAAAASAQFDANAAMATGLGDQTAQAVLGDRIETALATELKKLLDELKEAPGKQAKKLAAEIKDIRLEVMGLSAGQKAYFRTGGF